MILKNSKFMYLWTSQVLSQITVHMMNFLLLTRLFTVTGSSIATSLLWIAYSLPAIFVGPLGAASVDLVSKRKILMLTNLFQALTVFAYIFTHESSLFILYFIVFIYSLLNQFYLPAESSSLPSVVPKDDLPQANSLFLMTQQAAFLLGFGIAGVAQRFLGFNGSLIACSLFLFISFISVSFLPAMRPRKKVPDNLEKLVVTFFKTIYEGYVFIKSKKTILLPLMLLLGMQVALIMIAVNLPVIAEQILKISIVYSGVAIIVPAGFGAFIGAVIVTRLLKNGFRKKTIVEFGAVCLGLSLIILLFLPRIITPIFLFLGGLGFVSVNIPTLTFLQEYTPENFRGRVLGNIWFFQTILTIIPVLFSGFITEVFGVRVLLFIIAMASIFIFYYSRNHGQALIEDNFNNGNS